MVKKFCDKCKQYKTPSVTVDGVISKDGKILLIKRGNKNEPYYNTYALPGGFVDYGENTEKAIVREVWEETGLKTKPLQLIGVYSDRDRDPRRHTISMAYSLKLLSGDLVKKTAETKLAKWFRIDDLPDLAFDHREIIDDYLNSTKKVETYNGWDMSKKLVFCSQSKFYMFASELICKFVIDKGYVPINSFTNFGYFLYELVSKHDIVEGINNIINHCHEMWVFGPITKGVDEEIKMCRKINKPIRFFYLDERGTSFLIKESTEAYLRKKYKSS